MSWLDELTPDERRAIDNGALLGERHRVGTMIAKYRAVIEHQRGQPETPTREMLLTTLAAQVELLEDEHEAISVRITEHHRRQREEFGSRSGLSDEGRVTYNQLLKRFVP